jgi:hypothetical protein
MSSRLRWYIIGNLIGTAILIGGIWLINRYRAAQEVPQTPPSQQQTKTSEQSAQTKKEEPGPSQDKSIAE